MESYQTDTCTRVQCSTVHGGGRRKRPEILSANDGVSGDAQWEEHWSIGDYGIQSKHRRPATRNEPATQRDCMTPLTNAKKLISWRE